MAVERSSLLINTAASNSVTGGYEGPKHESSLSPLEALHMVRENISLLVAHNKRYYHVDSDMPDTFDTHKNKKVRDTFASLILPPGILQEYGKGAHKFLPRLRADINHFDSWWTDHYNFATALTVRSPAEPEKEERLAILFWDNWIDDPHSTQVSYTVKMDSHFPHIRSPKTTDFHFDDLFTSDVPEYIRMRQLLLTYTGLILAPEMYDQYQAVKQGKPVANNSAEMEIFNSGV